MDNDHLDYPPGRYMDFARIDLNLLVVFDTMMRERHVTRSASSIGLTQSATSSALARLRVLFEDELFVRFGSGHAAHTPSRTASPGDR